MMKSWGGKGGAVDGLWPLPRPAPSLNGWRALACTQMLGPHAPDFLTTGVLLRRFLF
jgi:hypothetical protein